MEERQNTKSVYVYLKKGEPNNTRLRKIANEETNPVDAGGEDSSWPSISPA